MTTSKRRSFREPTLLTKILLQLAAIGILNNDTAVNYRS